MGAPGFDNNGECSCLCRPRINLLQGLFCDIDPLSPEVTVLRQLSDDIA
jgi:hypothetical protein